MLRDIQSQIDFVLNDDKAHEKFLTEKRKKLDMQERSDKAHFHEVEKRIDELDGLIQSVYEEKFNGKIPEDVCVRLIEKYQAELKSLQEEFSVLKEKSESEQQIEDDVDEYIRRLKSYAGADELTRQMALELIEYITVDANPNDRKAPRDIHIYYKLIDKQLDNKRNALIKK